MAAVRVEEAYSERDETIDAKGNVIEVEIPYLVFNVDDESEALSAVKSNHKSITGMSLESVETVERINDTTWKVKAVYEVDEDGGGDDTSPDEDEDTTVFAFDTGGGTKHLNQSLKTDGRYPDDAPDFGGAIGVDNEGNVNGVEVTMPDPQETRMRFFAMFFPTFLSHGCSYLVQPKRLVNHNTQYLQIRPRVIPILP